jgi:hypothetical protein
LPSERRARAGTTGTSRRREHLSSTGSLDPLTLGKLPEAVRRSGGQESALACRRRLGLEGEPKMGVVVQALVEPEVARVLFTRHLP